MKPKAITKQNITLLESEIEKIKKKELKDMDHRRYEAETIQAPWIPWEVSDE